MGVLKADLKSHLLPLVTRCLHLGLVTSDEKPAGSVNVYIIVIYARPASFGLDLSDLVRSSIEHRFPWRKEGRLCGYLAHVTSSVA